MSPRPKNVKVLDNHKLEIIFKNDEVKIFDCKYLLQDKFYQSLQSTYIFETARIVGNTIEWVNGIDICPDELYENSVIVGQQYTAV